MIHRISSNNCFNQPTNNENIVCVTAQDNTVGWSNYVDICMGNKEVMLWIWTIILLSFWLNMFEIIERKDLCCTDCHTALVEQSNESSDEKDIPYIELTEIKSSDIVETKTNAVEEEKLDNTLTTSTSTSTLTALSS